MSAARALPTVPWFEGDGLEAYLARAGLDTEAEAFVRALARDGYALVDLGEDARALCDSAVSDTEPYFRRPGVARVQDAWFRSNAVRRLAAWPKVARLLEAAYGRRPFAFQTLNFRRGSEQAIHPDSIHFHSEPARFMCGVWIALEDVQPGSGPLVYYPGSHRLPVMTMRDAGVNAARPRPEHYERDFVPRFRQRMEASGLAPDHAVIPKGWAFVWAANLAHGGSPVTDATSTRRSLVVHNFFEDCLYFTPMMSDPEAGELWLRLPFDVARGGWVWPRRDGRRAMPNAKPLIDTLLRSLLRRPIAG